MDFCIFAFVVAAFVGFPLLVIVAVLCLLCCLYNSDYFIFMLTFLRHLKFALSPFILLLALSLLSFNCK